MSKRSRIICAAVFVAGFCGLSGSRAAAEDPVWIRHFTSNVPATPASITVDPNSDLVISGYRLSRWNDALVIKSDRNGSPLWTQALKSTPYYADDYGEGAATDADGNIYVVGSTKGALGGAFEGGESDAFVVKLDPDGGLIWKRQPGTAELDAANGVAVDDEGNIYVVGTTEGDLAGTNKGGLDAFLIKFDRDGRYLWKRQPGTSAYDQAFGVVTDETGVYLVGSTYGSMAAANKGGSDIFIMKLDRNGRFLWRRQPGTASDDIALSIAADGNGKIYVAGSTYGRLGGPMQGICDAIVITLDRNGRYLWRRQFGTDTISSAEGIAVDADGHVFVAGTTNGSLGGANMGLTDAFVVKLDETGNELWASQFGTDYADSASGVVTDTDGNAYVVARMSDPDTHIPEVFLAKYAGD